MLIVSRKYPHQANFPNAYPIAIQTLDKLKLFSWLRDRWESKGRIIKDLKMPGFFKTTWILSKILYGNIMPVELTFDSQQYIKNSTHKTISRGKMKLGSLKNYKLGLIILTSHPSIAPIPPFNTPFKRLSTCPLLLLLLQYQKDMHQYLYIHCHYLWSTTTVHSKCFDNDRNFNKYYSYVKCSTPLGNRRRVLSTLTSPTI